MHMCFTSLVDFGQPYASPQGDFRPGPIYADANGAELNRDLTQDGVFDSNFFFHEIGVAPVYFFYALRRDLVLLGLLQERTPEEAIYPLSVSPSLFRLIYSG